MKSINIQRAGKSGQSGFTIIELVVVILLLGILAATALPRFMDVTTQAHSAVVDGVLGGLTTGGALYRAQFVGQGSNSTTVTGFPITASLTTGYPNVTDSAGCVSAYNALLQGGRPTIVAGSDGGTSATKATNAGQGVDLIAALGTDGYCVYSYIADVASGSAATKAIAWNKNDGESARK